MIVKTYEIMENENTYIVNEYASGTIEKFLKTEYKQEPIIEEEILTLEQMQEQILLNTEYLVAMQELSLV